MKRAWLLLPLIVFATWLWAADAPWIFGRIQAVKKNVNTKTKAWIVNTPITEDEVTYTISVHIGDKLLIGTYELTSEQTPPPEEWTTNYPVRAQVVADRLYLRAATGDVTLHIVQRKTGRPMVPLTDEEKKQLTEIEAPSHSLTGFAESSSKPDGASSASPQTETQLPPPPANVGTVNVRSTPYLSEVFVDGNSMGYTPAKINLPPGNHTFRVEKPGYKPWTKEMTITVGSELTLDTSLEKK